MTSGAYSSNAGARGSQNGAHFCAKLSRANAQKGAEFWLSRRAFQRRLRVLVIRFTQTHVNEKVKRQFTDRRISFTNSGASQISESFSVVKDKKISQSFRATL